jgi:arylsulfatase A
MLETLPFTACLRSYLGWLATVLLVGLSVGTSPALSQAARPPNFVIIFADDLGYGDLGCFGHPTLRTPNLDRMAAEGVKLTQFYSASCVCTPSRAALLTGRLPIRTGMCSDTNRVLFPNSKGGLPAQELTLAEALRERGYRNACVGKWHLGHRPEFLPTRNGFDEYFGIPYSNDMDRTAAAPRGRAAFLAPKVEYWNVPLMRGEEIVERPTEQTTLTRRYTEEATRFVRENRQHPFFLYLAHSLPHIPLFRSRAFQDKSLRGLYGDVVEEVDWSVGEVLKTLRAEGIADNTLVLFTSDNGPWLTFEQQGGSAGLLRGGKGSTWEGGMREPAVAWWPGTIPPGRTEPGLASTLDLWVTLLGLAGGTPPEGHVSDGVDMFPLLTGAAQSRRRTMFFYRGRELFAVRHGAFKAHFVTQPGYNRERVDRHQAPLLFHLEHDPSEKYDVAAKNPEVIATIRDLVVSHRITLEAPKSQLDSRE